MTGWKRWFYHNMGWVYDPTETTEQTKLQRHELMIQIKSFNDNIQNAVLLEKGEVRELTPITEVGILDNDSNKIKPSRKRKRRKTNNYNF